MFTRSNSIFNANDFKWSSKRYLRILNCMATYTHTHEDRLSTHTHARMRMQFIKLQLNFTRMDGILLHLTYCNPSNCFCFPCRIICVSMKIHIFQSWTCVRPKMLSVTQPQLTYIVCILLHCDIKTYILPQNTIKSCYFISNIAFRTHQLCQCPSPW